MVNINPDNVSQKKPYKGTLERYTKDGSERFGIDLLFKLADTNKDGNVDANELKTLDKKLSEKSIFGDGVLDNKEFKDYVKDFNKDHKSDPSQLLEFSKEDMANMKDMKSGITQSMFDKFKEFCNIRLGKGDINTQTGINGKISLDEAYSSKQDQTGDCYFLTAVNILAREKDGDISDYIKPDGKGGAVVNYKGLKNSQGGKFEPKVSESEINFVREYQKNNAISAKYMYGAARKEYSILSKGDDDVLAMEIAEMKYEAYRSVVSSFECTSIKNPRWLQDKTTELLQDYVKGLPPEDKNELSRYILTRKKLEPYKADLVSNMKDFTDEEINAFEFNDEVIQRIRNNPTAFKELVNKMRCEDSKGNAIEKTELDDEYVSSVKRQIANWKDLSLNAEDMQDLKRRKFERIMKILKAEDIVNSGGGKQPEISNQEIKNYRITRNDFSLLYASKDKNNEVAREKLEAFLMEQFSNVEIKDNVMLNNYNELIHEGGHTNHVLRALAGAESIETEHYGSLFESKPDKNGKVKNSMDLEKERSTEIKTWIDDAKNKGYSHVEVSIRANSRSHAVLFKDFDAENGTMRYYNPWDMNKVEECYVGRILHMTAIKLPDKNIE